jgi:hypothetical protein
MMATAPTGRQPNNASPPRSRPLATWVLIGVPVALLLLMAWQIGSGLVQSQTQMGRG